MKVPSSGGKEFIEVELISIQNANVNIYEGVEALLQGSSNLISIADDVKQFDSSKGIFLVADFTGDSSSFLVEYRMSSILLEATYEIVEGEEVEEVIPVPVYEVSIAKEEFYFYLFILTCLFSIVKEILKQYSTSKPLNDLET